MTRTLRDHLSYTQIIVIGFALVILLGTFLLCLPVSSREQEFTPVLNSLFTATSATCVTGLVVYDTFSHWSVFGQTVIMLLIQVGGLGFMTIISMFSIFFRRKVGMYERRLLMQSEGNIRFSGVIRLLKRILIGTLCFEGTGVLLLSIRFCPQMGFGEGLFNAFFHSISAFCNAGFDIMGKYGKFSNLTAYVDDPLVSLTIAFLIIIGGIGFIVWNDMLNNKLNIKKYALHSKLALTVTGILLFCGTLLFMIFENDHAFKGLNIGQKVLRAFFQATTPRTAGFNTVDLTSLSRSSEVLTVILMFIGGSPGSTAGGIKTTTLAVLVLSMFATARQDAHFGIYRRRFDEDTVKEASAIFTIYTLAVIVATLLICALEPPSVTIDRVIYEVVSAIGTVGLSMGITPTLCGLSKLTLILLMFGGRVGGLSLILTIAEKRTKVPVDRPKEKIMIG